MGLLILSVCLEKDGGELSSQMSQPFLSDLSETVNTKDILNFTEGQDRSCSR